MFTKKYMIALALGVVLVAGATSLVLAEDTAPVKANVTIDALVSHPQPTIVNIGPRGNVLLRGTVSAVGNNTLTVKSWGGDWVVNISSATKLAPEVSMTQFKVGDFVGLHGTVNQTAAWTIDATLVRNWTVRKAVTEIRKEIKTIAAKNWQGIVSNVNSSTQSFTITIDGKGADGISYAVTVTSEAKLVNQNYTSISFGDIKNGDKIRVWGPAVDTTIAASVVRNISIASEFGLPAPVR